LQRTRAVQKGYCKRKSLQQYEHSTVTVKVTPRTDKSKRWSFTYQRHEGV